MRTAGTPTIDAQLLQVLAGVQSTALPLHGQGRCDEHARDLGQLGRLELGESERYPATGTASHDPVPVREHEQRDCSPTTPGIPAVPGGADSRTVRPRWRRAPPNSTKTSCSHEEVGRGTLLHEGRDRRRRVDHHQPEDRQEDGRAEQQVPRDRASGVWSAGHQASLPDIAATMPLKTVPRCS